MSEVITENISLKEIYDLAFDVFSKYGCDQENATALSRIVHNAERDGSLSHGLFRVPGYVASLKSGKVKGEAEPNVKQNLPTIISVEIPTFGKLFLILFDRSINCFLVYVLFILFKIRSLPD